MGKITSTSQLIEELQESQENTFLEVKSNTTDVKTVEIMPMGYYDEEIGLWEEQVHRSLAKDVSQIS